MIKDQQTYRNKEERTVDTLLIKYSLLARVFILYILLPSSDVSTVKPEPMCVCVCPAYQQLPFSIGNHGFIPLSAAASDSRQLGCD